MSHEDRGQEGGTRGDQRDRDSFESWKRSLRSRVLTPPAAAPLEGVLEKMVSLSELLHEIEEKSGGSPEAAPILLGVPAGRRIRLETLGRLIDREGGPPGGGQIV